MSLLNISPKDLEREIRKMISQARPQRRRWTAVELDILKRLYEGDVDVDDIAQALGRTKTAVNHACERFSLKRLSSGSREPV